MQTSSIGIQFGPFQIRQIGNSRAVETVRATTATEVGVASAVDRSAEARSKTASWNLTLTKLLTDNFRQEGNQYAYIMDNGSSSSALKLSQEEYQHIEASLKLFQNMPTAFIANSGMNATDSRTDPQILALGKAFYDLKGPVINTETYNERRKWYVHAIARIAARLRLAEYKTSLPQSDKSFKERKDQLMTNLHATKNKLQSESLDCHLMECYTGQEHADYKGPSIILFPDMHYGGGIQNILDDLHYGQSCTMYALAKADLITQIFSEGTTCPLQAVSASGPEVILQTERAAHTPTIHTMTRLLSQLSNGQRASLSPAEKDPELTLEHMAALIVKFAIQEQYDNKEPLSYTKEIIEQIKNVFETSPELRTLLKDKLDAALRIAGIANKVKFQEYKDINVPIMIDDVDKKTLEQAYHRIFMFEKTTRIYRNRDMLETISASPGDNAILMGTNHCLGFIIDAVEQKIPIPITIVINNQKVPSMQKILKLKDDDGYMNAVQSHNWDIGDLVLKHAEYYWLGKDLGMIQ